MSAPPAAARSPSGLVDRVRHRMVSGPGTDVAGAVRAESGLIADEAALASLRREVTAEIVGAGPLEPLLALPGITDVLVTAPDRVWVDRGRGIEATAVRFANEDAVRRLAQRLVTAAGRRLDDAQPFADATMPDGTRVHAVLPPVTPATTISLRVLARRRFTTADLVAAGTLPADLCALLEAVVAARLGLLVSGGTGSGKTTLLGALLGTVDPAQRLVLIEDVPELVVAHPHVVRLRTRAANIEGAGEVGLRDLVRQALRMRPDRLVVGEFRGPEAVDLLVALNTGHEGGAATVHANSVRDVPSRLAALAILGGLPGAAVGALACGALQVLAHLRRTDGGRAVCEVGLVQVASGGDPVVRPVWRAGTGYADGIAELRALIGARGVAPP